jgi:hypothetical protein
MRSASRNYLDPLSHLSHYAHAPAIAFECGADDTHVGPEHAVFADTNRVRAKSIYRQR